jgi:hypothetical protein
MKKRRTALDEAIERLERWGLGRYDKNSCAF